MPPHEYQQRRARYCEAEAEWLTAWENPGRQRQHLQGGVAKRDLFVVYQSARWLAPEELAKVEAKSLKTPTIQVLVGWFRDGKLDQVERALADSADVPEAGAGKVLVALREAIPVLYWQTDERLGRLGKELERLAAEAGPAK